ncbi:D-lactate dehydrogenase [cytochrome] [Venturia inaequalis]|nr:D-lactate dehydrogenase [cytochrome] [Venturia inaequalis]
MKLLSLSVVLFMAATHVVADYSTCIHGPATEGTSGFCVTYNDNGGQKNQQSCRGAKPCNVKGNGCIRDREFWQGGWYANCS